MPKIKRSRAFALISVMALMTVLIILLGALIGTNRTSFQLLRYTQSKDRIDRTINSVYSYCRASLEKDFRWGKEPFEGRKVNWGHLEVTEIKDARRLVGIDTENKTRFEITLVNNLRDDGEVAILADIHPESQRSGVPAGFCRFEIAAEANGQVDGAQIVVRNPGLVGAVALSADDLNLQAQSLVMVTRDPVKNQARSDKRTRITGMSDFVLGRPTKPQSIGEYSTEDPVFWSGQAARYRDSRGEEYQGRAEYKKTHPDFKDERFVDESEAIFGLPEFGVDDLAEVRAANGSEKPVKKVSPGVYRFEQYGLDNGRLRVLTVRDLGPSGDPGVADGPIRAFYYMNELDPGGIPASAETAAALVGAPASLGTRVTANENNVDTNPMKRYVAINADGGAYADLRNRRLVFDEKNNFEVDGALGIIGSAPSTGENPHGSEDLRQVNPGIYFGDPERIAKTANYTVAGAATVSARSPEKGSLKTRGRLTIQGDISGSTTIVSGGDVEIRAGRFYDVEGNSELNFSVFSEGNVSILPPPIHEDAPDREVSIVDGSVRTDSGRGLNVSEQDLKMTGLLYAKGSVNIDLQNTVRDDLVKNHRNLIIEGAMVARSGGINVHNANNLELVYNPQYVDQLLPEIARRGRRIEVTGWRSIKPVDPSFE